MFIYLMWVTVPGYYKRKVLLSYLLQFLLVFDTEAAIKDMSKRSGLVVGLLRRLVVYLFILFLGLLV